MKSIRLMMCSVVAISLVAVSSQADQKTPITEASYSTFQSACQSECVKGAKLKDDPNDQKKTFYCACACVQATMNCRTVVGKYNLHYEEEMMSHEAEMMPDLNQLNICKTKAGL